MDKQSVKVILPMVSTGLAGLIAGGTLYVGVSEAAARSELPADQQLAWWRVSFVHAKRYFLREVLVVIPSICASAYVSDNPSLYLASVPFVVGIPYTKFFLNDTNDKLMSMTEEEATKDDGSQVTQLNAKWAKRHAVRSYIYCLGFVMCLGAVSRKIILQ